MIRVFNFQKGFVNWKLFFNLAWYEFILVEWYLFKQKTDTYPGYLFLSPLENIRTNIDAKAVLFVNQQIDKLETRIGVIGLSNCFAEWNYVSTLSFNINSINLHI